MKKTAIIFSAILAAISMSALGYLNWNASSAPMQISSCIQPMDFKLDFIVPNYSAEKNLFFYDVHARFYTVTKSKIDRARYIVDLVPDGLTAKFSAFDSVKITVLNQHEKAGEISSMSNTDLFNAAQLKLIRSLNYSTNFYISAIGKVKNMETGRLEDEYFACYLTIVPEKEATYADGHQTLIDYIRKKSEKIAATIDRHHLKPGKVSFTISKKGTIEGVRLTSTSGFTELDEELIQVVKNMNGSKWTPAQDWNGELIDQELVLFFGIEGC